MSTLRDLTARVGFEIEDKPLEHLNAKLEGIHRSVELLAGIELAKFAYEWVESFSSLGERLESAAVAAGITTNTFQQLAFAASQNAVSQEEMSGSLARFSRIIGAARDGSKQALATFAQVGISKEQIDGFSDASEGMQVLADHIQGIQDPIKRTQIIMQMLGRGSANMTKFLSQGGAGIRDKMVEAQKLGAVVSERNVKNLAELEDSVSSLGLVFRATAANLAGYFSPAIVYAVDRIKSFWSANHELIEQDFRMYARKVAFALGFVVGYLHRTASDLFEFAKAHQPLLDAVGSLILRFIEFKVAIGLAGAAFGLIAGPFKQLAEGLSILKGTLEVLRFGWPVLIKFGGALVTLGGNLAALTLGIGGPAGLAILVALGAAIHDVYTYLSTGDVTQLWLYQLIMAIKSLSVTALRKLGLMAPESDGIQEAKDKAAQMPLSPISGNAVGGSPLDFGHMADRSGDIMDSIGDLSHAQNMPPSALARPSDGASIGPVTYNVDSPITVNVPPNADPKAIAQAAQQGVSSALHDMLRRAHVNTAQAAVY